MKKFIATILAASLLIIFVPACKKDKPLTTTQKIQNKWTIQSLVYNDYYGGSNHPTTSTGLPGDYIDFRTDAKAYSNVNGVLDTMSYTIVSDSRIAIDGDNFDIKSLTESAFVFYSKEFYTTTDYDEVTISLKR